MEPLLIILLPGVLGGILLALLFSRLRTEVQPGADRERLEPPSIGMINMAHIRVNGLGGLGMVAMSIVVAIFVPRIRLTMVLALVLGTAMAALLIAWRRRGGPLPSGNDPGAHSMLMLETPPAATKGDSDAIRTRHDLAVLPVR
jgi:hypothetical protein